MRKTMLVKKSQSLNTDQVNSDSGFSNLRRFKVLQGRFVLPPPSCLREPEVFAFMRSGSCSNNSIC